MTPEDLGESIGRRIMELSAESQRIFVATLLADPDEGLRDFGRSVGEALGIDVLGIHSPVEA